MTDTKRIHRELGVLYDKAAAEAERHQRALSHLGIAVYLAAAIVAGAIATEWTAIVDRLVETIEPARI